MRGTILTVSPGSSILKLSVIGPGGAALKQRTTTGAPARAIDDFLAELAPPAAWPGRLNGRIDGGN